MGTPTRLSVAIAAILSGCATPYKPESGINHDGYSEQRREPGVYDVWFRANHYTPKDQSDDLVLLRAAELCLGESKPFMRTSNFQSDSSLSVVTPGFEIMKSVPVPPTTGPPPSPVPTVVDYKPGRALYTTRSGVKVECLTEKGEHAEEAEAVAAAVRERYAIAVKKK